MSQNNPGTKQQTTQKQNKPKQQQIQKQNQPTESKPPGKGYKNF